MITIAHLFRARRRRSLITSINVADNTPSRAVSAINVRYDPKAEWTLLKYGVYPNKVGLQVFDREAADAIVRTFNSKLDQLADGFRGLPFYVGHPDDPEWAKQNPTVKAEAVGRLRELQATDQGLRFRVAWNETGKRLVDGDAPAYDAYSPNWGMIPITYQGRKAFRPVELYSNGLTNQPNIPGTFIGLNEALPPEPSNSTPMNKKLIELLALFGITLGADATDAQATTAINEALPKATTAIADQGKLTTANNEKGTLQTQLTSAQAAVQTATNESSTLRTSLATERSARAGLVITRAINEGRLTEAKRAEWLGKFTATGADFGAVEVEIGKLEKAVNTKSKADIGGRRGQPVDQTRIRAINEEVLKYQAAHQGVSHDAAYSAVRLTQSHLFGAAS